jgi:hypothetical protein
MILLVSDEEITETMGSFCVAVKVAHSSGRFWDLLILKCKPKLRDNSPLMEFGSLGNAENASFRLTRRVAQKVKGE